MEQQVHLTDVNNTSTEETFLPDKPESYCLHPRETTVTDKTTWGEWIKENKCCILVIVVLISLAVGVGFLICNLSKPNPTDLPPSNNSTNAQNNHETFYDQEACVFHTSAETMNKLKMDPFGDRCTLGSRFVNDTCGGGSGVLCQSCNNGMLLPRYCFCDRVENCKGDKGAVKDAVRKFDCHECVSIFRETFIGRASGEDIGTCNNAGDRTPVDSPQCKDGFGGFMCFTITKRVCKPMNGQPGGRLRSCEEEEGYREEKCTIIRNQDTYLCRSFDDSYHQNNNLRDCGVS